MSKNWEKTVKNIGKTSKLSINLVKTIENVGIKPKNVEKTGKKSQISKIRKKCSKNGKNPPNISKKRQKF